MTQENPALPGQDMVVQAAVEAAYLPVYEQEEQHAIVADLVHELVEAGQIDLVEREQLMALYDENMRIARGETADKQEVSDVSVHIDADKIDWITSQGDMEVEGEQVHTDELDYTFVDLTGFAGATQKAKNELSTQRNSSGEVVLDKIMQGLKQTYLPTMYRAIRTGGTRAVPYTRTGVGEGRGRAATDYPAYRISVQGTNNRAIALIIEGGDNPVIALAAVFDHESDMAVYRSIR